MLVSKKNRALVMRLRDPSRVTSVIPKAKTLTVKGKEYVAVRHGVNEVKVLRNIGIEAPSPIHYHYDWPGRYAPYDHQREVAGFLTDYNRAFNLSDLGTGKTLATLWAYDFLRKEGVVHKALVITPLSTLERTWADEIFQHFPHLDAVVLHGNREKRLKMLDQNADLYLINHDGIKVAGLVEALANRPDIDVVIVDEIAQVGRTAGTDRFKTLLTILNRQHPRLAFGLTGTPTPNAPTDAWAQCRLLVPERVPPYFNRFKDQVMRQVSTYTWIPRDNATEIVHEAMQPSIRFSRDECLDLPPVIYETREVEMTPEQKKAYKAMSVQLSLEYANGDITAANEAVKVGKLIQIACGAVYDNNGEAVQLDASNRLSVIRDVVEESNSKTIVFVPYVSAIALVADDLRAAGHTVECIHGGVGKNERDRIFTAFQKSPDPHVLVAQPAAMSHGLTLTAASTIVWYAPLPSNDIFQQANARITRPGQVHTQLIIMVQGSEIERKYYKRLKEKERVQGLLLEMVESAREFV